jgi:TolB-like protein
MKRALLVAAMAALPLAASAAPRTKIAVTEIKAVQGVSPGTATILSDIVVSEVARAGHDVISQSDIKAMVGFEQQKKMLGCTDDSSCLAEIGGALGVDYMLTGQVGQIGTRFRISLLVVDTKKARVAGRSAQFCDQNEDALARAAESTVRELLASITTGTAPKIAETKAPADAPPPAKVVAAKADATPPAQIAAAKKPDLAARPAMPAPASPAERGSAFRPSRRAAWLTLAGGAVLMAGGAAFGLQAQAKKKGLEDAWANPDYAAVYDTRSKEIKAATLRSNLCWGAGLATTGVATWMFFRSRSQLAIAPAAGDGQLGLVASGTF